MCQNRFLVGQYWHRLERPARLGLLKESLSKGQGAHGLPLQRFAFALFDHRILEASFFYFFWS